MNSSSSVVRVMWSACTMFFMMVMIAGCGGEEGPVSTTVSPAMVATGGAAVDLPKQDIKAPFDLGKVIRQVKFAFREEGDTFSGGHLGYAVTAQKGGAFTVTPRHEPVGELAITGAPVRFETVSMGDGVAAQAQDGHLAITRGAVTEHLRNSEEGVEQSWSFAQRPTGGDVVIRVAVSGMAYIGETTGGLHFAQESGIGVRYGHAKWIDNDKKQTAIPAVFRDGHIELTVPRDIIDGSSFPAVLDPGIGAEFGMDSPVAVPNTQTQYYPDIAFDGTNYLVVWQDYRMGNADIYGARVSKAGTLLDVTGIAISGVQANDQAYPSVAFNGTSYLVVWMDLRNGSTWDIYGARVNTSGSVLDATGIVISNAGNHQQYPDVAADGTNFMAIWYDSRTGSNDIYGARVSNAGTVLDGATGIIISNAANDQVYPAVAFDGTNYFAVWQDTRSGSSWDIYGARIGTNGVVVDPAGIMICNQGSTQERPDVAFNGTNYLVAWTDYRAGVDIYGGRVAADGTVLDGTGVAICSQGSGQYYPAVASDGTGYVVAWMDQRNGNNDIYGARVDADGNSLDPIGFAVSIATNSQEWPALVFDGANYFAVWQDSRNGQYDIYGTRIGTNGTVVDGAGILLSGIPNNENMPSVAFDGTNYLVVWHDYRSNLNYDIYGTRVSAAGTVLDPAGIAVSISANNQQYPMVAFDGTNYLVVWQDLRNGTDWNIYGTRVSKAGAVLNGGGIAISTAANHQQRPRVAFDGTNYMVVWSDLRSGTWDIYGARMTPAGSLLDASGIAISTIGNTQEMPAVVYGGGNYFVVWHDLRSGSTWDIYGARVTAAGVVTDLPNGLLISNAGNNQQYPVVDFDGTNYMVAWMDSRGGTWDIYGARVNTSGGVIDASGIAISTAGNNQQYPAIVFGGNDYLVAWMDYRSGTNSDIYGARVKTDATVLDAGGLLLATDPYNEQYPAVARGATDTYLLVYESYDPLNFWRIQGRILELFCPAGYYGDLYACTLCPAGTYSAVPGARTVDECHPCADGSISAAGATSCTPCAAGKYESANACLDCAAGEYAPFTGMTACLDCAAGSYAAGTGSSACTSCDAGYFQSGTGQTSCDPCAEGTFAAAGSSSCTQCPIGTAAAGTANASCTACAAGSYAAVAGQATCDECVAGTYNPSVGQGACLACAAGSYTDDTGNISCELCDAGYAQSATGQTSCDPCNAGKYNPSVGQSACMACAPGTYSIDDGIGKTACSQCAPGQVPNSTQTSCDLCAAGSYASAGSATCTQCVPGTANDDTGQAACTACAPGTYAAAAGQTTCDDCVAGEYNPFVGQASCMKCAVGSYTATPGNTVCTQCAAGYAQPAVGETSCTACAEGTYASGIGNTVCTQCAPGTANDDTAQAACTPCAVGTYASAPGSATCTDCAAGTYAATEGRAVCTDCAKGFYAENTGSSSCTACAAGKYAASTGQATCDDCAAGTYNPSVGQMACMDCAAGSYTATTGNTVCTQCAAGYAQPAVGETSCVACAEGTYAANAGSATCTQCAPGTANDDTAQAACTPCAVGTYAAAPGSTTCTDCAAGEYNPSTGQMACMKCAAGSYTATTGNTVCTQCAAGYAQPLVGEISCEACVEGTFAAGTGNVACTDCPAGNYNDLTAQAACAPCAVGTYAAVAGSVTCDDCATGYYGPVDGLASCLLCGAGTYAENSGQSACESCDAGTYAAAAGSGSCADCDAGTYAAGTGNVVCTACPVGMNSLTGADSCWAVCGDGMMVMGEACDDGNKAPNDGCSADCTAIEPNWICPEIGEPCVAVCTIDGTLYTEGEVNPDNICQSCHTATSREAWTNRIAGTLCDDDGKNCTADTCDGTGICEHPVAVGCLIDDTCIATGAADPDNECRDCNPALATDAYSHKAKGLACTDDGMAWTMDVCDGSGLCTHPETGKCVILGVEYAGGASNPANGCQMCDPATDPDDWSVRVDGFPCISDGLACTWDVCNGAGICENRLYTGCLINNACVAAGAIDPENDCMECAPAVATDVYSARTEGVLCADDGLAYTRDICDGAGVCEHPATGNCVISGVEYAGGAADPENVCQVCDPGADPLGWSYQVVNFPCETDGLSCTQDVCNALGVCEHPLFTGCMIEGSCVTEGAADPLNACMACDTAAATDAYSARIDGYPCADEGDECTYDICAAGVCAHPLKETAECQPVPDEDTIVTDEIVTDDIVTDDVVTDDTVTDDTVTDDTVTDDIVVDNIVADDMVIDDIFVDTEVVDEDAVITDDIVPDETTDETVDETADEKTDTTVDEKTDTAVDEASDADEVTTDEVTGDEMLTDEDTAGPDVVKPKDSGCGCSLI